MKASFVILSTALAMTGTVPVTEAGEQRPQPTASVSGSKPAAWPPPHMRNLPSDYPSRQRASLGDGANLMDQFDVNNGKSEDSIIWVRGGLAALVLGKQVAKVNRLFESDKFVWLANRKYGFSLFSTDYMRLYALLNHRTGLMKSALSQAAQDNFEQLMWSIAKTNSLLTEGQRTVLEMEDSENHHLTSKVCDFLAAQYLRNIPSYGFATPDYILGSAALDASWLDDLGMGFRWQGIVFASDPLARIGFEVKPTSDKDWHGFNPFFSVQDRNVLITQKWAPVPPNPPSANPAFLRVYFSPTLDDVQEDGGWIFVKDGGAFAGIKVVSCGYAWMPAWKHADSLKHDNKSFITLNSENSPVILIANQAADYNNDFNAFKTAVKAQPVRYADGELQFATITFHGTQPGKVGGHPVNLAPARGYDSPFIRSDWNSGLIFIRKANETEILDFRDPKNPVKTVGAPVTPEFPPGLGNDKPIIFSKGIR